MSNGDEARMMLALIADRDRIARDLHDLVIQRLFGIGLQLQNTLSYPVQPEVAQRLNNAVSELDTAMRDIRSVIFQLHEGKSTDLRSDVRAIAADAEASLRFRPHLMFIGPMSAVTDHRTRGELLAVLREALSNVVRHSKAERVDVSITVDVDTVELKVSDDGRGIPEKVSRGGLLNLEARARGLDGTFTVSRREPTGTLVVWTVPRKG
jgi:signal transduction histidine kinase